MIPAPAPSPAHSRSRSVPEVLIPHQLAGYQRCLHRRAIRPAPPPALQPAGWAHCHARCSASGRRRSIWATRTGTTRKQLLPARPRPPPAPAPNSTPARRARVQPSSSRCRRCWPAAQKVQYGSFEDVLSGSELPVLVDFYAGEARHRAPLYPRAPHTQLGADPAAPQTPAAHLRPLQSGAAPVRCSRPRWQVCQMI
jgi:hypothetical protein